MASFEQHINVAVIGTGLMIVPLYSADIININQALILLSLGILGGVLPDLDSDNSKPIQIAFRILSIFVPLLILLGVSESISIFHILIVWLLSYIVLQILFTQVFLKLTVHRGIFHSLPMGLVFALTTIALFHHIMKVDLNFSTISGLFIFLGFIIHLLLDELFSVNALGISMKKSAGTAFKLYDKNNMLGTFILYLISITLLYFTPLESETFHSVFNSLKNVSLI